MYRQVTRALAQRPALRRDALAPDSVVPDLVAVTALLNGREGVFLEARCRNPRDEAGQALVACLLAGCRASWGVIYASTAAPQGGTCSGGEHPGGPGDPRGRHLRVITWRTSSFSNGNGGNCVEVGPAADAVLVRDTKNRTGGTLTLTFSGRGGGQEPCWQ